MSEDVSAEGDSPAVDDPVEGADGSAEPVEDLEADATDPETTSEAEQTETSDSQSSADGTDVTAEPSQEPDTSEATDPTVQGEEPLPEGAVLITFNVQDGTPIESMVLQIGDTLGELPIPEREGYNFFGWYFENREKVDENTVVTENITLHAAWISAAWEEKGEPEEYNPDDIEPNYSSYCRRY